MLESKRLTPERARCHSCDEQQTQGWLAAKNPSWARRWQAAMVQLECLANLEKRNRAGERPARFL